MDRAVIVREIVGNVLDIDVTTINDTDTTRVPRSQ